MAGLQITSATIVPLDEADSELEDQQEALKATKYYAVDYDKVLTTEDMILLVKASGGVVALGDNNPHFAQCLYMLEGEPMDV